MARPTVVIVEDEEPIAAAVAARLRSEGFDTEIAGDGPSGVALVDRLQPDLVVLDLMLPGMDGLEVCRRIQRDRAVPVLMLTDRPAPAYPSGVEPPVIAPMLATGSAPPRDPTGYLLEPKWDGVRVIVTVHDGNVRLVTRNSRDVSSHYPELAGLAGALAGHSVVLDGEVVTFDDKGCTSFQRLQKRMHVAAPSADLKAAVPVLAMLFDLLWLDGELLTGLPQKERRRRLEELPLDGPSWHLTPLLPPAPVKELLRACDQVGLEGYMLKRGDATYLPGRRSSAWIKLKCIQRREVVVGGWVEGQGGRSGAIGSLAVGLYGLDRESGGGDGGGLHYMGTVGSGLTEDWIRQLTTVAERLGNEHNPFVEQLVGVHFLEPRLVAEVAYTLITDSGTFRHPTLHGFRTDLDPAQVVADEALQEVFDRRPPRLRIRV